MKDALLQQWTDAMRRGDFTHAWHVGDTAIALGHELGHDRLPPHQRPIWNGEPVDGRRVHVRCLRGLGDTIQFLRFLPLLADRAASVTLSVQRELREFVAAAMPNTVLCPADGCRATHDVDVEIMELAHVLRVTPHTIPSQPLTSPVLRLPCSGVPRVGVAWRAGEWVRERSIPFAELEPLLDVPGVEFHALSFAACTTELHPRLRPWPHGSTVNDLAAAIASMDLVITVDTMTAHLGGALARPTWTLLHHAPDWRWMRGERTPWYPTMRLFRQRVAGDWTDVLTVVAPLLASEWTAPLRTRFG